MAKNDARLSTGLAIDMAPDVDSWIKEPLLRPSASSEKLKKRIQYVFDMVEAVGRQAGTEYLDAVHLDLKPPLLEVRVNWNKLDFRIFGVSQGNRLYLVEVVKKKKQSLSTATYESLHRRAVAYAESRQAKERKGGDQ